MLDIISVFHVFIPEQDPDGFDVNNRKLYLNNVKSGFLAFDLNAIILTLKENKGNMFLLTKNVNQ